MDKEMEEHLRFIRLCQYMYKIGAPLTSDTEYDAMIRQLPTDLNIDLRWDLITEEEGMELMTSFSVAQNSDQEVVYPTNQYTVLVPVSQAIKEEFEAFKLDKNLSIPIVTDNSLFTQVHKTFEGAGTEEVFASLKLDGWNVSLYIKDGEIVYGHTRGKQAEATDITSIMKMILRDIDGKFNIKKGYVVGELYLESSSLPYLRTKYNKDFKTTRNSLSTFINNKVIADDMPLAQFGAFKLEIEGRTFDSPSEMYGELVLNGFKNPKHEIIPCDLSSMASLVIGWGEQINHLAPSDGIVLQPNSYKVKNSIHQIPSISGSYEVGLYAIKMGAWGEQVYKTVIKEITLTSNTKSKRPSLIVEPVVSRDGRKITVVPIDHVGRLVDEDLFIGKEISIRLVSEKDIRLVYDTQKSEIRRII